MARVFLSVGIERWATGWVACAAPWSSSAPCKDLRFLDASPLYRTEPWERPPGRPDEDAGCSSTARS